MPPSAFSDLACRSSIRRMAPASISRAPQSSMPGDNLTCAEENVNTSERTSHVPTWYMATMVPASARLPLTYDLDVDVCVVGALRDGPQIRPYHDRRVAPAGGCADRGLAQSVQDR